MGDTLKALALDTNGRIVTVGHGNDGSGSYEGMVARFNTNGSLDTTFGNGQGFVLTDITGLHNATQYFAVKIQGNGKIVAGGNDYEANYGGWEFAAVRYNVDGSLDTTFNSTGFLTYAFPSPPPTDQIANGLALTSTGNIVLAGWTGWPHNFGVVLIDPNAAAPAAASAASQVAAGSLLQVAGLDSSSLASIAIRSADLGGATPGLASGNTIWLADNAAGRGWFVDPTPAADREFTTLGNQGEQHRIGIAPGSAAATRDRVFADADSALFHDALWNGPALDWI